MKNLVTSNPMAVVLSCEHGGNRVPPEYRALFEGASTVLESHRGWDPGALMLFDAMQKKGVDYAQMEQTTRLLIDLNRSLFRRTLFSEFSGCLTPPDKQRIIDSYYLPFRDTFKNALDQLVKQKNFVFHVSVHSFTPRLNGVERNADVGLLYNPSFGIERKLAIRWRKIINQLIPGFRVRMNYPYLGKTDGHVAALRRSLGPRTYAGIELEMNQKYAGQQEIVSLLSESFHELIAL